MKAKIKRWGINGEGIAFVGRKPVFIPNAIPGETAEIKITRNHDHFAQGEVLSIEEKAPRRREPICPLWESCGGCGLMHVDYKGQIRMKEQVLKEALKKYAGYEGPIEPMIKNPDPLGYRNACKLPFGKKDGHLVSGMYRRDSNEFVAVERCVIHSRGLEKARQEITRVLDEAGLQPFGRKSRQGLMNLVLKEFDGKVHALIVSTDLKIPQETADAILALENVASLWQSVKEPSDPEHELFGKHVMHLGGAMKMDLQLGRFSLDLLPRSFFQLNTKQALALYEKIAKWTPPGAELLVEAYSGIGAISLFVSEKAKEVIGIEWIEDAVANAQENALINGAQNVRFVCGDAAKEMEKITAKQHISTLICDPPRSGLDDAMKAAILRDMPESVLYISCNPATLGKDLRVLQSGYTIEKVQPYDFFSQTPHVETAVLLKKKPDAVSREAKPASNQEKRAFRKWKPAGRGRKNDHFRSSGG